MAELVPKASAMLICDHIITEQGTKKKSLIGIFENIGSLQFPFVHPQLCVYIKLTEARGRYRFRLDLVQLKTDSLIGRGEIPQEVTIADPLTSHELVFNLRGLRFTGEGEYEFRIFANDHIFGQKTFYVRKMERPNPAPENF